MTAVATRQTVDVTIQAEVLHGTWETFGVDRAIQILPETLVCSANEWGPDKASFVLRRSPWAAWPDLQPYTPIEIEIGGVLCWSGRTGPGTPLKAGAEQQISVQCEGWQYHLDDALYKKLYVHATLTDWRDARSYPEQPLDRFEAAGQVQVQSGSIVLTQPKGTQVVAGKTIIGVVLDLGEAVGREVVVTIADDTMGASWSLYCQGLEGTVGYAGEEAWAPFSLAGQADTIHVGSLATPRRYIYLMAVWSGGTSPTVTTDEFVKIWAVSVFGESVYRSGEQSVLKASWVVGDALTHAPLLSSDHSQIEQNVDLFHIPSLVMTNYRSPREMIEAVNAFHDWTTKIDLARRPVFAPRPTEPLLEIGSWSGEEVEDTSAGEGSEIYDAVVVEGTEANGAPLAVTVTKAGNVPYERGFSRAKSIPVSGALTIAMAEKIGEVWLNNHQETPFAGAVKAPVGAVRNVGSGQPVHPSLLLRYTQELLRVSHMIDPNTGGVGRDGLIAGVTYNHAQQMAEIALNSRLDNFDPLLERLAVLESVGA